MEVTKLQAKAYPLHLFRNIPKDGLFEPENVEEQNSIVTADFFGDIKTQVRIDLRNGEVWGRCTCQQYDPEPCIHIKSLAIYKLTEIDNNNENNEPDEEHEIVEDVKKLVENGKAGHPKPVMTTSNETRAKTVLSKVNQVLEVKAAEIADRLDEEQMRILDLTDWSEDVPLVYEIKFRTKHGEVTRHIISWNGLIMACNMQGGIQVEKVEFTKTPDGKDCAIAVAVNTKTGVRMVGISTKYNNEEFKWETLASKAIRNAVKKVVDPQYIQQVIKYAQERKALKSISLREATTP